MCFNGTMSTKIAANLHKMKFACTRENLCLWLLLKQKKITKILKLMKFGSVLRLGKFVSTVAHRFVYAFEYVCV